MAEPTSPTSIKLAATMSVKELADRLDMKVSTVMTELIRKGVMATINDRIDFATAKAVAEVLGVNVSQETAAKDELTQAGKHQSTGEPRPPVMAMMGHVDHGKTTLLDAIRKTDVAAQEAGGITQHLSAYQIKYKNRTITFIDTPGHEAFTVLREHGAHLTDVAIIVVAADDGVKPQTLEAIKFAQKSGVKILVAITKVDKPDIDLNRVKQQLSDSGLTPEEWGGDTVVVEVSAKTGTGLDKLLDLSLLVADIEELKAPTTGLAEGTVIEAHMAAGKGPLATLLVTGGLLAVGNYLVAGQTYAKLRRLESTDGQQIEQAGPSYPAVTSGWKSLPPIGERFYALATEKEAKQATKQAVASTTSQFAISQAAVDSSQQINVLVKADVNGSLESVIQSLGQLGNKEVGIKIIAQGAGPISESDIYMAQSSRAEIIGFNVSVPIRIKQLAEEAGVKIRLYKIIYELLDDARANLEKLLTPEVVETVAGQLEVRGVFRTTVKSVICGGLVKTGKLTAGLLVRKPGEQAAEIGKLVNVQKEQRVVASVVEGEMCGLNIATKQKTIIKEGDLLEFFSRQSKERTL